jgi:glycosyltransferase involved in cell wall biosynthesis
VRQSSHVVANSRAGLIAWKVPSAKGRVVHNGFDFQRLNGLACHLPRRNRFEVVMVARVAREKDYPTFCDAARYLQGVEPGQWHFTAVGDGDSRERLMRAYHDVSASGALDFVGFLDEVLPAMASADVGVLLTDPAIAREGCSNTLMEYMACGLPVLCTDGGGNPELIESGKTGLVITAGSLGDFIGGLVLLRDDEELRSRLGGAAARHLRQCHSPGAMADAYVALYRASIARDNRACSCGAPFAKVAKQCPTGGRRSRPRRIGHGLRWLAAHTGRGRGSNKLESRNASVGRDGQ